jgi:aromatic-L-amino-acid decarboxylase
MDRPAALGDVDVEAFRAEAHRLVDWIAAYLAEPERYPVLSPLTPGDVRRKLPTEPPRSPSRWRASWTTCRRSSCRG